MSIVDAIENWSSDKAPDRDWIEPAEEESSDEGLSWSKQVHRDVIRLSRSSSNPCREMMVGIKDFGFSTDFSWRRIAAPQSPISEEHLAGIRSHIDTQIGFLSIPSGWQRDGYTSPSSACRALATRLLVSVFVEYHILPYKIAASREGGITAAFRSSDGKRQLSIEIDEDFDVCGVVSNDETVLASGFLDNNDDKRTIIEQFLG